MNISVRRQDGARWAAVADGAAPGTLEVAARAALRAQRSRLTHVDVDVLSDAEWPPEVRPIVREAELRLAAGRHRGIALPLDPADDEDFEIALGLAPFSIGSTGLGASGRIIWSVNDTGTSACFHLTTREEAAVRSAVTMAGGAATDLVTLEVAQLARRDRSYDVVGATTPGATTWQPPDGWRAYERSVCLGSGPELWHRASSEVLRWGVKTRSGFLIAPGLEPGTVARRGDRLWLTAHIGPLRVREPVEVVETSHRTALAYGTLVGHPVTGEEAFIVDRDKDGNVTLTLRSLTHAGRGRWWALFPAALVAQQLYRRRYLRALAAH